MDAGRVNSSSQVPSDQDPFPTEQPKPKLVNQNSPETLKYWARIQERFNEAVKHLIDDSMDTPPKN